MPDLSWDEVTQQITGAEQWRMELEVALNLGVQQLTVHVPRAPAESFRAIWRQIVEFSQDTSGEV